MSKDHVKQNQKKSEQLGISYSKANHILRKSIIFSLIQKCGMDTCHRCGNLIESVDDMSIDHIEDWLHSDDPTGLYFDTENIAFSHLKCNVASRRTQSFGVRTKSGLKGVYYDKDRKKKWRASICYKDRESSIGRYDTPIEAAKRYDEKAIELFGDKAVTNKSLGLID